MTLTPPKSITPAKSKGSKSKPPKAYQAPIASGKESKLKVRESIELRL